MVANARALTLSRVPTRARPGVETLSAGAEKRSSNCAASAGERTSTSISKKRLRLHASRLQVPTRTSSRSRTNALAWSIAGWPRMRTPASSSAAWWRRWAAAQGQLFALAGTKRRTSNPAAGGGHDPADHPAVGDVGVDHVERLAGAVERLGDGGRDRPVAPRRVVQHGRRDRAGHVLGAGKSASSSSRPDRSAQPAEGREEDELQLRDHRAGQPHEEVVEAAVVEVVLDPGTADPADAPVDDDELAMVDVAELAHAPARGPPAAAGCDRARSRVARTTRTSTPPASRRLVELAARRRAVSPARPRQA